MNSAPISNETFIKEYYAALEARLSKTELAKKLGISPGAVYQRVLFFKRKTGKALPPLRRGSRHDNGKKPNTPASPTPKTRKTIYMPATEFVTIWQKTESLQEISQKTGLRVEKARQRAAKLRKLGVPLKRFPGSERLDVPSLIALAERLAAEEAPK